MKEYGSAFTWNNIDEMDYMGILLLQLCMKYESKAMEWEANTQRFYAREGIDV